MLKLVFCIGLALPLFALEPNSLTRITLDNEQISVYFNDGDTFHFQNSGRKTSARLKGFNTLESYGPVHQWGHWTTVELSNNASLATQISRQGGWHCRAIGTRDYYGRILVDCPDLASKLVQKGLAHVMMVDSKEDSAELLNIQEKAIQQRLGMWKKGAPDFILTSVHSAAEDGNLRQAYDRFVSTKTGHSLVRQHHNAYDTCEKVAYTPDEKNNASSMIYIPFQKRYGLTKATCLKTSQSK